MPRQELDFMRQSMISFSQNQGGTKKTSLKLIYFDIDQIAKEIQRDKFSPQLTQTCRDYIDYHISQSKDLPGSIERLLFHIYQVRLGGIFVELFRFIKPNLDTIGVKSITRSIFRLIYFAFSFRETNDYWY